MKGLIMKIGYIFVLMVGGCSAVQAQSTPSPEGVYILSGRILEKGNKAPVLGGSLYLEAVGNTLAPPSASTSPIQPLSSEADLQGNYKLSVPSGNYRLVVGGLGFKKISLSAFLVGQNTRKDFYLERDWFTLPEVVVSTNKIPKTQVSHETISKEELTEVAGSQEDVLKAIQSLPGVANAGSYDGRLLVRGNGPNDNQYFVDNIPIGYPYHFGIASTLDSNLIKDADFYSGGYGAQFPNSLGGLVDLTQRDPRSCLLY